MNEHPRPLEFMANVESRTAMYRFLCRFVQPNDKLLDVGCGEGDFVTFASRAGAQAQGLDADPGNVQRAQARGLDVQCLDAFAPELQGQSFDVVSMIHLIEHFEPTAASSLVALYASTLSPGGRLILVTPNYADWSVASHIFWLDPTHRRPYPGPLLCSLAQAAGLRMTHCSTQRLVKVGRRQRLAYPLGRLRFGREFERMNLVVVAERPTGSPARGGGG